jgi:hypothetical protein
MTHCPGRRVTPRDPHRDPLTAPPRTLTDSPQPLYPSVTPDVTHAHAASRVTHPYKERGARDVSEVTPVTPFFKSTGRVSPRPEKFLPPRGRTPGWGALSGASPTTGSRG